MSNNVPIMVRDYLWSRLGSDWSQAATGFRADLWAFTRVKSGRRMELVVSGFGALDVSGWPGDAGDIVVQAELIETASRDDFLVHFDQSLTLSQVVSLAEEALGGAPTLPAPEPSSIEALRARFRSAP